MSPLITRWFSHQNNSSLTYTTFFVSLQSEQQLDKMLRHRNRADEHKDESSVN